MTLSERAVDRAIALVTSSPVRAVLIGAVLLYVGARTLGWWTVAVVVAAAAWEFVRWPGRLPWRWS